MRKQVCLAIAIVFTLLCVSGNSFSASLSFTDEATWLAAVTNVTLEDYESYAWTNQYGDLLSDSGSVTLGSITYSFPEYIFGVGPTVDYDADYLTGNYLMWQNSPNLFTINFNQAVTAFSFDFGEFSGSSGLSLSVILGNGDELTTTNVANDYSFFGVTSDTAFTSITLNSDIDYVIIDNLAYADAAAPVPEPATMLLFGTGLAGLVGFRLRREKK